MKKSQASRLKRPRHPMPAFVRTTLVKNKLMTAYRERPPYQQNDYLGWIIRAKLEPTRQRRLAQMLDELVQGDRYMKMAYRAKRKTAISSDENQPKPDRSGWKTCSRGHKYRGAGPCPKCWPGRVKSTVKRPGRR